VLGVFVQQKYHRPELKIPSFFDSSKSEADYKGTQKPPSAPGETDWRTKVNSSIRWIEKGPLRATVKTHHDWPLLKFETYITLSAGLPWVEVTCRVLAQIPPAPDVLGADKRFPTDIQNGYWLSFTPGFSPTSVIRDFPLGIESSARSTFQARTFVDLVEPDAGLLVLHPGTQYFRAEADRVFSNLIMREWESYFTGDYGWPRYAEYRHALVPHDGSMTHADRVRAAEGFSQKLITLVGKPQAGSLPPRKSFVSVEPKNLQVLAFRKKEGPGFEIRTVDVEGKQGPASVKIDMPLVSAFETNLLGKKIGSAACKAGKLDFEAKPWKIQTFEIL
jgi:hypothetical protein